MRYQNVCLESIGYTLPDDIITSEQLETALAPLYSRLRLPEGRLELITGISQRRVWPTATLPSDVSIVSGRRAIEAADVDLRDIGVLVHASVCRDHLEPATACRVHHELELPRECVIYDLSNACLGLLNGVLQVANMIELKQVRAGIVVGSEGSRQLLESTIRWLNECEQLKRSDIKPAIASLTIGSGSCAIVLTHRDLSRSDNRLLGGVVRAHTNHHQLCHSGKDEAVATGMQPLMETASEELMQEGIATGEETFRSLLAELEWERPNVDRSICHQVGGTHRKLMLEALGLLLERDFTTFPWLGNTGSVALPITLAIAAEQEFITADQNVALLGIGSGINCVMLGVHWQKSRVLGGGEDVEELQIAH
jgi:3-oxoacyl-[acyl-carrier-protein] synthase-3